MNGIANDSVTLQTVRMRSTAPRTARSPVWESSPPGPSETARVPVATVQVTIS